MDEARDALKTYGETPDEIEGVEINLAEEYEAEDRIHLAMQHFKFKQN